MIPIKAAEHEQASTDNSLAAPTGPHFNRRAVTEKDGGHFIMTDNSTGVPAPFSGISKSFTGKASTKNTAEALQRPVFKVST